MGVDNSIRRIEFTFPSKFLTLSTFGDTRIALYLLLPACVASLPQSFSWFACFGGTPFWIDSITIDNFLTSRPIVINIADPFTRNVFLSDNYPSIGKFRWWAEWIKTWQGGMSF